MIAREIELKLGIWLPDKVFEEIRKHGPRIQCSVASIADRWRGGQPCRLTVRRSHSRRGRIGAVETHTRGYLVRYSKMLNSVLESPGSFR